MGKLIDVVRSSLPVPEQILLEGVRQTDTGIVIEVRSRTRPRCPTCAGSTVSYHSRYKRRLRDLPWQGRRVEIHLHTRRFRCRNTECRRRIFAEQLPAIVVPRARETCRLGDLVGATGYALGGLPACRLLQQFGLKVSRDTILRRVKWRIRGRPKPKARVLGVDDWAWRKRQHYGTMLMDLESRRVTDLLPVRSANSFADWLPSHSEVSIITRDRSSLYADGGRQGAPNAVQILDRYHLVSNLSEAVERDVQQMQIQARAALLQQQQATTSVHKRQHVTLIEARRQRCRQARYQRYMAVMDLRQQGYTPLAISEKIGMQPDTVARWLNAGGFPNVVFAATADETVPCKT